MNTTQTIDVTTIPRIGHTEAMDLQAVELSKALGLLRSLDSADWDRQTECPDWNVRQMWQHVLGACEAGASMRENARQMLAALRRRRSEGVPLEAGLSGVQVADRAHLPSADVVAELEQVAPRTIRARRRLPRIVRAVKIPIDAPIAEKWSLGYLTDVIYLRDLWMHRIDTSRAVDRTMERTADHDGRIVADIVAEWARRHGTPFTLELTGPAGGTFVSGTGGDHLSLDAVEFCRTLSGRAPGNATGLLATIVPF